MNRVYVSKSLSVFIVVCGGCDENQGVRYSVFSSTHKPLFYVIVLINCHFGLLEIKLVLREKNMLIGGKVFQLR